MTRKQFRIKIPDRVNIRPIISLVALCIIALAMTAFSDDLTFIVPEGRKTTSTGYAVPTLDGATLGYKTLATPTVWASANTASSVGTLPLGTKYIEIYAFINDINYGPPGVGSGTSWPKIASGTTSNPIPVGTTTPNIYVIGRAGAASATILAR